MFLIVGPSGIISEPMVLLNLPRLFSISSKNHKCRFNFKASVKVIWKYQLQSTSQGGPGSVRFGYGFRGGTVRAVPVFGSGGSSAKKVFSVFQHSLTGKDGSSSSFGSWKAVPAVPVPLSVSGKTVPTVPVRFLSHPDKLLWGNHYRLQLQFWPCRDLIHVTATALGWIPRKLTNHRNHRTVFSPRVCKRWTVVSKRWFELCGGTKFRYPPFYLNLTPLSPQFCLLLTSF